MRVISFISLAVLLICNLLVKPFYSPKKSPLLRGLFAGFKDFKLCLLIASSCLIYFGYEFHPAYTILKNMHYILLTIIVRAGSLYLISTSPCTQNLQVWMKTSPTIASRSLISDHCWAESAYLMLLTNWGGSTLQQSVPQLQQLASLDSGWAAQILPVYWLSALSMEYSEVSSILLAFAIMICLDLVLNFVTSSFYGACISLLRRNI